MLIVSLWKGGLRVGSRPEDSGSPHGITVRRGSTGTADTASAGSLLHMAALGLNGQGFGYRHSSRYKDDTFDKDKDGRLTQEDWR